MASILDQYGIKEVCDVTFYETVLNDGVISAGKPVLYLNTLKVSTVETTAETTSSRGGKGNPELITWDFNKEITLNIEDALFSAKSMAIMFGAVTKEGQAIINSSATALLKTLRKNEIINSGTQYEVNGVTYNLPTTVSYYGANGETATSSDFEYATFEAPIKDVTEINISAKTFPGTYYVTGDTFARDEAGHDSAFQIVIPKAKVTSEATLTMEAEGDPSTFSMNLRVLNPAVGPMMKLIKYTLDDGSSSAEG